MAALLVDRSVAWKALMMAAQMEPYWAVQMAVEKAQS